MKAQPNRFSRGATLGADSVTFIPADATIRPTQDHIIVEPVDNVFSAIIELPLERVRYVKGIVRAVGKGIYPKHYDHPDKHSRTKMWDSKHFRPCDVRVGDLVSLGAYAFQSFYWGDRLHFIATERDVCGIHTEPLGKGAVA